MKSFSRQLGFWESLIAVNHDHFCGTATGMCITQFKGHIDINVLKKAFELLFNRHPLLRATLEKKEDYYWFQCHAKFSDIPIDVIHRSDDALWEREVEKISGTMFPIEKHLWSVKIISPNNVPGNTDHLNELIITFHHSIMDALSCVQLVDQLLTAYSKLLNNNPPDDMVPLPLLGAIKGEALQQPLQEEKERHFEPTVLDYQGHADIDQRITKSEYRTLDEADTLRLIEKCRANDVSVNSALSASFLLSVRETMEKESVSIPLLNAVGLRKRCQPKVDTNAIGCYGVGVETKHHIDTQTSFWSLAKQYSSKLDREIPKIFLFPDTVRISDIMNIPIFIALTLPDKLKSFPMGFFIADLGRLALKRNYGELELSSCYLTTIRQSGDIPIALSAMTLNNKIFHCFSYTYPLMQPSWASKFADNYFDYLKKQ